jgi:hypothetical protein
VSATWFRSAGRSVSPDGTISHLFKIIVNCHPERSEGSAFYAVEATLEREGDSRRRGLASGRAFSRTKMKTGDERLQPLRPNAANTKTIP